MSYSQYRNSRVHVSAQQLLRAFLHLIVSDSDSETIISTTTVLTSSSSLPFPNVCISLDCISSASSIEPSLKEKMLRYVAALFFSFFLEDVFPCYNIAVGVRQSVLFFSAAKLALRSRRLHSLSVVWWNETSVCDGTHGPCLLFSFTCVTSCLPLSYTEVPTWTHGRDFTTSPLGYLKAQMLTLFFRPSERV